MLAGWCPRYSETWVVYEVLYVAKSFPIWKLVWRGASPQAEVKASSFGPVLTLLGTCILCGSPLLVVIVFVITLYYKMAMAFDQQFRFTIIIIWLLLQLLYHEVKNRRVRVCVHEIGILYVYHEGKTQRVRMCPRKWDLTLPWPHTITNIIILISNNCTLCHVQRIHKFQAIIIFKDFEEWKYYKLHRMKPFSEKAKPVDRNLTNGYCFSSRCSLKDNFSQCWEP